MGGEYARPVCHVMRICMPYSTYAPRVKLGPWAVSHKVPYSTNSFGSLLYHSSHPRQHTSPTSTVFQMLLRWLQLLWSELLHSRQKHAHLQAVQRYMCSRAVQVTSNSHEPKTLTPIGASFAYIAILICGTDRYIIPNLSHEAGLYVPGAAAIQYYACERANLEAFSSAIAQSSRLHTVSRFFNFSGHTMVQALDNGR